MSDPKPTCATLLAIADAAEKVAVEAERRSGSGQYIRAADIAYRADISCWRMFAANLRELAEPKELPDNG